MILELNLTMIKNKNTISLCMIVKNEEKFLSNCLKSIENFVNQEELTEILKSNKFYKPNYKNLSGGIVSIHSGWKI